MQMARMPNVDIIDYCDWLVVDSSSVSSRSFMSWYAIDGIRTDSSVYIMSNKWAQKDINLHYSFVKIKNDFVDLIPDAMVRSAPRGAQRPQGGSKVDRSACSPKPNTILLSTAA
jgi:hypothetical protein